MSFYAKERIEKLRKAIKKLPPLHEMTHAQRIAYYCNLSRIDELKMEWGIQDYEEQEEISVETVQESYKQEERVDSSKLIEVDEKTQSALKKIWERR